MSKKKMGILTAAVCCAALLILGTILGCVLWRNARDLKAQARKLQDCWQEGNAEAARAGYYTWETEDTKEAAYLTKQQTADQYGLETLQTGNGGDLLFKKIMEYSQLQISPGLTLSETAEATLRLLGPDLESWLLELSGYERADLIGSGRRLRERLEEALQAGEVPFRYVVFRIPAQKQNGVWRFAVTQEAETALWGGLYPA